MPFPWLWRTLLFHRRRTEEEKNQLSFRWLKKHQVQPFFDLTVISHLQHSEEKIQNWWGAQTVKFLLALIFLHCISSEHCNKYSTQSFETSIDLSVLKRRKGLYKIRNIPNDMLFTWLQRTQIVKEKLSAVVWLDLIVISHVQYSKKGIQNRSRQSHSYLSFEQVDLVSSHLSGECKVYTVSCRFPSKMPRAPFLQNHLKPASNSTNFI